MIEDNQLAVDEARRIGQHEAVKSAVNAEANAEIANGLVLSPATVKTHVSRILAKLAARDRAQLVMLTYESGLVVPRDT